MRYRVSIEEPAEAEINAAYLWIAERSPRNAARWYARLSQALQSLRDAPFRCSLARESRHFPEPVRQLVFGRGQRRFRALFLVRGRVVHVLHFRHWARAGMHSGEIEPPA